MERLLIVDGTSMAMHELELILVDCPHNSELDTKKSNPHVFELHRPSIKGTRPLFEVIKAIIIIATFHVVIDCPHNSSWSEIKCSSYGYGLLTY